MENDISPMSDHQDVTIYDIAKYLNISASTVSRGLKNNPMVKHHTRKRINDAAQLLGYSSNAFASSLRTKQTKTIGVIVPRLNSHYMSCVIAGIEKTASNDGYSVIISQSFDDTGKETRNAATMFNKRVDGLLISPSCTNTSINHLQLLFKQKIPVVFLDRIHAHSESTTVSIDNREAAYTTTKHLIDQGCKKIMHLGGDSAWRIHKEILEGYQQAINDARLKKHKHLYIPGNLSEQAGIDAAAYILRLPLHLRPDAVFAASDNAAAYCMRALLAAGLSVPSDIAFAGFNNDPVSRIVDPNITTVDYSGEIVGHTAATCLIDHLRGATNIYNTNYITLRAELIVRKSSLRRESGGV